MKEPQETNEPTTAEAEQYQIIAQRMANKFIKLTQSEVPNNRTIAEGNNDLVMTASCAGAIGCVVEIFKATENTVDYMNQLVDQLTEQRDILASERVDHPSVFILDELEARAMTVTDLASAMANNPDIITPGVVGVVKRYTKFQLALDMYIEVGPNEPNMRIGPSMAADLAIAFDVSEDFLFNLEKQWLESQGVNDG